MKNTLIIFIAVLCFAACTKTKNIYITTVKNDTTFLASSDTVSWIYPTLNSGWSTTHNGTSLRYKFVNNIVYVSGTVYFSPDASHTIFTLLYNPRYINYISASDPGGSYQVVVYPNGSLCIYNLPLSGVLDFNCAFPIN